MFPERLREYYKKTAPLIGYYYAKGLLTSVDGMADIDAVTRQIEAILSARRADPPQSFSLASETGIDMAPRDIVSYVFLAVAWGASFVVLVRVVDAFGWAAAVSFRSILAGGLLWLVARRRRPIHFDAGWKHYSAVGATTVAGQLICLSYATPRIGTAMAAIMVAAIPLFSMLIAQAWGTEKITRQRVAGLLVGTVGIVLARRLPGRSIDLVVRVRLPRLACRIALCRARQQLCQPESRRYRSLGGDVGRLPDGRRDDAAVSPCGAHSHAARSQRFPAPACPRGIASALTYVIYFRLVSRIGATRAISVEFAVTVVAVLIGGLILDEPLTLIQLIGGGVIIAGCILVLGLVPWRHREPNLDATMPGHG